MSRHRASSTSDSSERADTALAFVVGVLFVVASALVFFAFVGYDAPLDNYSFQSDDRGEIWITPEGNVTR
jgi:hypothetical protein